MIAESIALAKKQQETQGAELTSSELVLFEDAKAEHSTAVPVPVELAEQSAIEPVEQAELPVAVPEPEVEVAAVVPEPEVIFCFHFNSVNYVLSLANYQSFQAEVVTRDFGSGDQPSEASHHSYKYYCVLAFSQF